MKRLALLPFLFFVSCSALAPIEQSLSQYTPKLHFQKLELKHIDFSTIDVDFLFTLENPNPLSVKLDTFGYALGLEGVEVVRGNNNDGLQLKSYGESQLAIPVSLTFARIFELVKAVKGKDDLGFLVNGELGFNTPLGVARVPFKEEGRFPVVHTPDISLEGMRVGKVDLLKHKASLAIDIGLANPDGGAAVSLAGFDYGVDLGGTRVAAGVRDDLPAVSGGAKQTVELPIDVDLLKLGSSLVQSITKKKAIDVKLAGVVQVGTPFGKIPLTFDELSALIPK